MKTTMPKHAVQSVVLPFLGIACLVSGCVAIPMGKETYTTKYDTGLRRAAGEPAKTYDCAPALESGDEHRRTLSVGLVGEVTAEQPQEQTFKTVTVEKHKRLAIGLFPKSAQTTYRPKGSLTPIPSGMYYVGDGRYSTYGNPSSVPTGAKGGGSLLTGLTLGLVANPISLLVGIFGPFENDRHFLGSAESSKSVYRTRDTVNTSVTYKSDDLDLLLKFSPADRERIGAWTFHENDTHPHNTFWNGFDAQWVGVVKYCNYFVRKGDDVVGTEAAAPRVEKTPRTVLGPYRVTLSLPELGFRKTAAVQPGDTKAVFNLPEAANGRPSASGTVSFQPPPDGWGQIRNPDDKAMLSRAMEREWPVTVALPAPRLTGGETNARQEASANYRIEGVDPVNGGIIVRVRLEDTSKTFEVHRAVRPEILRIFREQFASEANPGRQERVQWKAKDDGRLLIYKVSFE